MSDLEEKLGFKFQDSALLEIALSHRSVGSDSNERLEFLGDSVLGFIIANELYHKYPNFKEGELSRLRANLVNSDVLAELAKEFELSNYLHLGVGERRSGGYRRNSILADAVEAIIGAIYLDSDMENCRRIVLSWFAERIDSLALISQKDAKSQLQEYLQAHKMPLPEYTIVKITGKQHAQLFQIKCIVAGYDIVTEGHGRSRQRAEQVAAEKFLAELEK